MDALRQRSRSPSTAAAGEEQGREPLAHHGSDRERETQRARDREDSLGEEEDSLSFPDDFMGQIAY